MINPSDQNDNFLLYCQPTEETITKRKRKRQEKFREDDDEFEDEEVYKCTREYRCTIKTDEETKRSFVFFFKDNEVVFNECNSKVILQVKGKVTITLFIFEFFFKKERRTKLKLKLIIASKRSRLCSSIWSSCKENKNYIRG